MKEKMTDQQLQYLIRRYRQGTITADEQYLLDAHWERMLQKDALAKVSEGEKQLIEDRIYSNISRTIHHQRSRDPEQNARSLPLYWARIAASISVLLLVAGGLWFWIHSQTPQKQFETAYGEKKHVVLPEGSEVWLNGHSSLRYAVDSLGNREVWLDGEAQFIVRHTATNQKFVVHTDNNLAVEVLGTVFNVVNRRGSVNVVLHTGSVQIIDETTKKLAMVLQPNEMVSLTKAEPTLTKSVIKAQTRLAWKDGAMYVENKSLDELFAWINDTYGISVVCSASLRQETFAGTVRTDSIDSFFDVVAKLYQVNITKEGQIYLISE